MAEDNILQKIKRWKPMSRRPIKAVPLQARRGPEFSKKLMFPDFVTTAQHGGRF